jgi:hypothetical protein
MKAFYCCLICLFSVALCNGQRAKTRPFPFTLQQDGSFGIVADVQDQDLYPKYYDLFRKYGYEGNGECWAGLIRQILERKDPELLKKVDFDPEAGAFYAYFGNDRQRFIELISPVFANLNILEGYIKTADRSRIDD